MTKLWMISLFPFELEIKKILLQIVSISVVTLDVKIEDHLALSLHVIFPQTFLMKQMWLKDFTNFSVWKMSLRGSRWDVEKTHQEEILFVAVHRHCEAERRGAELTRAVVQVQEGGGVKHTVHLHTHSRDKC